MADPSFFEHGPLGYLSLCAGLPVNIMENDHMMIPTPPPAHVISLSLFSSPLVQTTILMVEDRAIPPSSRLFFGRISVLHRRRE
jgi:hypothetical protein